MQRYHISHLAMAPFVGSYSPEQLCQPSSRSSALPSKVSPINGGVTESKHKGASTSMFVVPLRQAMHSESSFRNCSRCSVRKIKLNPDSRKLRAVKSPGSILGRLKYRQMSRKRLIPPRPGDEYVVEPNVTNEPPSLRASKLALKYFPPRDSITISAPRPFWASSDKEGSLSAVSVSIMPCRC